MKFKINKIRYAVMVTIFSKILGIIRILVGQVRNTIPINIKIKSILNPILIRVFPNLRLISIEVMSTCKSIFYVFILTTGSDKNKEKKKSNHELPMHLPSVQ